MTFVQSLVPRVALAPLLTGALMFLCPAVACAQALSVEELNEKVDAWRAGKKIPPPIRYQVEGRGVVAGRHRLQFKNCKVPFESRSDLNELTRRNANVEVTGTIVRNEPAGTYVFQVESARELPGDLDVFLEKRRELRKAPAEKWYELGRWARRRGEFYRDHELLARSEEANLQAVELDRQALSRENPQGLLALAETARELQLPDKVTHELVHEALVAQWRSSRKQTGEALTDLLKQITARLPGATEPLPTFDVERQREYFSAPRETYRQADAEARRTLHRMLYADVLLRTILPELAPDGSNGFAVAEKLHRLIPEQHALIESLRNRALAARAREIEKLSKSDMLALAQQYRDLQQPLAAEQVMESWLMLRQRRLDPDDIEGLIALTDEFRKLLQRHERADRMLIDAWQRNPKATDLAERLQQAGYRLFEGKWLTSTEFNNRPEGRLEQAIRAGRIEPGMTSGNVRRSLGEPQRLARAATSGEINEVWTYDSSGTTRLTVRLRRNRRQSELTVVDVSQTSAERP